MTFTLKINCDNAAFEDNPTELLDILTRLGQGLTRDTRWQQGDDGSIFDTNGNMVGEWTAS